MIRFDEDGTSYGGFRWAPIGKWTICPDWNTKNECSSGLFGQSPMAAGFCKRGSRMILAETYGVKIAVDGNKIKVERALILAVNDDIPIEFLQKLSEHNGTFDVRNYKHQLPAGLTSIGGSLDVRNYKHQLPAGLKSRSIIK